MQPASPNLVKTLTWIAALCAVVIALTLPVVYFTLSYQNQVGSLEAEAEINGRLASQVISVNPEMWRFQELKLSEFLKRRPRHGQPEIRRIFDHERALIAESVDELNWPLLTRSIDILDSGLPVGRLEISRSLRPLVLDTAGVLIFSSALGGLIFLFLRTLPLRALERASAENARFLEELKTAKENLEKANDSLTMQAAELTRSNEEVQQRYRELEALHDMRRTTEEILRERNNELLILRRIGEAMLATLDLNLIIEQILEQAMLVGSFDLGNVRFFDASGNTLVVAGTRGYRYPDNVLNHRQLSRTMGAARSRFGDRIFKEICCEENVQTCAGFKTLKREGVESFVSVPLRAEDDILGIIQLGSRTPRKFKKEELNLFETIGNQLGIAVQRARLYEETKRQARELEKASKLQADFSAMIVHDLRSPLTNIMAVAEVMIQGMFGSVTEEQKTWLSRIQANSHNLVDLVSDFLDVSKLESGYIALKREPTDLGALIQKSIETYRMLALDKKISLKMVSDPSLPPIYADPKRLDQVLTNLINNAIKFTGENGEVEVGAARADGAGVNVWIKDNGEGIPADEIGHIFEKYRQVGSGKQSSHEGTGLGLVICKMIVNAHGGKIWVESEPKKGSTFYFSLPVAA